MRTKNEENKALKLLSFLKSFNKLKLKKILDIDSFEEVLWMSEIPKEKECYSIIDSLDSEKINFDKWLEIKKPKRKPFPPLPEKLNPWVKDNTLNKWKEAPQLLQNIIEESDKADEIKKIFLKDHPEIAQAFEDYLDKKWRPWAKEERRLQPVSDIYNSLYKIYEKNKDQGEIYQITLGIGFLSDQKENGKTIRRHVVSVPISIHFESTTGAIKAGPCNQIAELSLELDMFSSNEIPGISDDITYQLSDLENNFWTSKKFYNCLKSWINSYHPKGQFRNFDSNSNGSPYPSLSILPAIILRKRTQKSFLKFYDETIKAMEFEKNLFPCLDDIFHNGESEEETENKVDSNSLAKKYYFPLLANNDILNKNEEAFLTAEKINITSNPPPPVYKNNPKLYIFLLSNQFFKRFPNPDSVHSWGIFCSKEVKDIKKIKINGKKIKSYEEAKELQNWVQAYRTAQKLHELWKYLDLDSISKTLKELLKNNNFGQFYSVFKDLRQSLEECLSICSPIESINKLMKKNRVPQAQWTRSFIQTEKGILEVIKATKALQIIGSDFQKASAFLSRYEDQKNQIAKTLTFAFKNRSLDEYKKAEVLFQNWTVKQENFKKICAIKNKLKNEKLYLKIRQDMKDPELSKLWKTRLNSFEEAWNWFCADLWLKEKNDKEYSKQLHRDKKDFLRQKEQTMEQLVTKKAWDYCLSQLEDEHIRSLKGWVQAIKKLGKGTGKTAIKNRKIAKQRMEECKTAIPAWIMPLYRVVENIQPGTELFDIAIIDEASQTGPDGFLLNFIAKKIIVVGDKEQISPSMIGVTDEDSEAFKKKYLSDFPSLDYIGREYSYYDYCETYFTTNHIQLREHFRCMPEIISFSNEISYHGTPLIPLRQYGSSRLPPLKTTFLEGAVSKVGNSKNPQNEKEVQAIIDQLKACIKDPNYEDKTFGIISLQGNSQIQILEKALSEAVDKLDIEDRMIRVGGAYDFQGDERDVIFLSMVVSSDYNFRALTGENDKKRYNVSASRAKDQLWLFHSIKTHELSPEDYRRKLLEHCLNPLQKMTFWERSKLDKLYQSLKETKNKSPDNAPTPFGSWFEAQVFYEIASRGYQVIPQYEVSGYYIDMIIVGSKERLAVECDGPYHDTPEQTERDIARQWQLERCGWAFFRIKGSAFYRNQEEALKGLWQKLDKMGIYPLGHN